MDFRLTTPCVTAGVFDAFPKADICLKMESIVEIFEKLGYEIKAKSDLVVLAKKSEVELALYRRGRLIIKNVKSEHEAEKIAIEIFSNF